MIRTKVEKTMIEQGMLPCASVLVGLSGGADSMALLHILHELSQKHGFVLYAAHVNHCLRGEAADGDEEFARHAAAGLGVRFFSLRADVRAIAEKTGVSEELAGRSVRYEFFEKTAAGNGIEFVATAHHKNDNAETLLMNFMRGSGIKGLCGIPYRRGRIIRPLLEVSREEIELYCRENGIEYVTDMTNHENVYTRNKIRNILIPMIEKEFNPSFVDTVTANARIIADEEDYIRSTAEKAFLELVTEKGADIAGLTGLHSSIALRVIRMMTARVCGSEDIPATVIASVLELAKRNRTGARVDIARGAYASIVYGKLVISKKTEETGEFIYELTPGKEVYVPELGMRISVSECEGRDKDGGEYFTVPKGSLIEIRNRRDGDRFCPEGMTGTKKLKSFMIDKKIPRDERNRVGLITVDGEIAWVIGHRRDRRFKFNKKGIKISISY